MSSQSGIGGEARRARRVVAIAVATLALASCGTGDADTDVVTEPVVSPTSESAPVDGDGSGDPGDGDNGGRGAGPADDADLPGEYIATYFSEAGTTVDVVGVAVGDVLSVRALPDATSDEVGRLAPTDEATLAGRERSTGDAMWAEVEFADGTGWVDSAHLAFIPEEGKDVTAKVAGIVEGADAPDDPAELARYVGQRYAETLGGGEGTRVILVETPSDDVLVYRVDILGLQDDSVLGERLEIRMEHTGAGHEVTEAAGHPICGRGAEGGLCV